MWYGYQPQDSEYIIYFELSFREIVVSTYVHLASFLPLIHSQRKWGRGILGVFRIPNYGPSCLGHILANLEQAVKSWQESIWQNGSWLCCTQVAYYRAIKNISPEHNLDMLSLSSRVSRMWQGIMTDCPPYIAIWESQLITLGLDEQKSRVCKILRITCPVSCWHSVFSVH